MTVQKLSGAMKYSSGGADSISFSGVIKNLASPLMPTGKSVVLNVSGAMATFTLNARGSGTGPSGNFALTLKPYKLNGKTVKGKFAGGDVAFKTKLQKGTWSGLWAAAGVDPTIAQTGAPLQFTITITLDGVSYGCTASARLTSKAKIGGKFK